MLCNNENILRAPRSLINVLLNLHPYLIFSNFQSIDWPESILVIFSMLNGLIFAIICYKLAAKLRSIFRN